MLNTPVNGFLAYNSQHLHYGVSAKFSCQAGHQLLGNSSTTCLATGVWSSRPPVCLPGCVLPHLDNAVILDTAKEVYDSDEIVHLRCPKTLKLVGPNKIRCTKNGTFDVDVIPRCSIGKPLI